MKRKAPRKDKALDEAQANMVARLNHWADLLGRGIPLTPRQSRELANYLHELAATPTALAAIVAARAPGAGRPPMRATAERNYWMVLNYDLAQRFRKRRKGGPADIQDLCEEWHVSRSVMLDACKTYRNDPYWKWWKRTEMRKFRVANPLLKGKPFIDAFVASLRAHQSG